jgi:cytochrome c oxidase cbb3-type subunit III
MTGMIKGPSRGTRRRAFAFLAGAALMCASGPWAVFARAQNAASKPAGVQAALALGKQVWAGNCAGCHGLDGRGGERGPNIATNPEIVGLSDAQISHIVRDGSPNMAMPALGRTLNAAQIAAGVRHLRTLQGDQHATALPGDPKSGEALFYGKAECSSCHMVAGLGGFIAQDLSDIARASAADEIRDAIVHPAKEPDPRAKTAVIFTRDGRKFMGIIRNEDNFSVQLQSTDGDFHLFDRGEIERVEYQKQSLMPMDYGTKLSPAELSDIVSFLMATSRARESQKQGGEHKDWEDKDED